MDCVKLTGCKSVVNGPKGEVITTIMQAVAEEYGCHDLVYDIYRCAQGVLPKLMLKANAVKRGRETYCGYDYDAYVNLPEEALRTYRQYGGFTGDNRALNVDITMAAMVLDAREYEIACGIAANCDSTTKYILLSCLARTLEFVMSYWRVLPGLGASSREAKNYNVLVGSSRAIRRYAADRCGTVIYRGLGFVGGMLASDDPEMIAMRMNLEWEYLRV